MILTLIVVSALVFVIIQSPGGNWMMMKVMTDITSRVGIITNTRCAK